MAVVIGSEEPTAGQLGDQRLQWPVLDRTHWQTLEDELLDASVLHAHVYAGGTQDSRLERVSWPTGDPTVAEALKHLTECSQVVLLFDDLWLTPHSLRRLMAIHRRSTAGATLAIVEADTRDHYSEQVEANDEGLVERVERSYSPFHNGDCRAVCILSGRYVASCSLAYGDRRLRELPAILRDERPFRVQELDTEGQVQSFRTPDECYHANISQLLSRLNGDTQSEYQQRSPGVWVHQSAQIDPSAILVAPVIVGPNVCVEPGAAVVGPAYLGEASCIGPRAVCRRSILLSGVSVDGETAIEGLLKDTGACQLEVPAANHNLPRQLVIDDASGRWRTLRRRGLMYEWCKRVFDIAGATIGLGLTLPLYPLIAAAIKIDSPGSVFYRQRRQGRFGRPFTLLKFRTMHEEADRLQSALRPANQVDGPQFKIRKDPRLTRVGKLLRSTNLDEVPQFWNILLGHVSLVGPRPLIDQENRYCPGWREMRLSVLPGVTGLWQTKRSRENSQFQEWIEYDTEYVHGRSLGMDLAILGLTVRQSIQWLPWRRLRLTLKSLHRDIRGYFGRSNSTGDS